MAKDTFYFSHDYNARTDVKIKKLIAKHGMVGYGIFWAIVEDLYNNANALPTDYESIAFDLRTDSDKVKSIICDFELFSFNGALFGSESIERRLDERNAKSEKARQSALKRWSGCERIPNAMQTQSEGNAIKERKGKEIKESKEKKETNEIDSEVLIYPTFDDFWNLYDKKVGRGAAEKKWSKLKQDEKEKIMQTLPGYVASTPELKYRKNPETYLNNKSWNDEIIKPTNEKSANGIRNPDGTINWQQVNKSADEFLAKSGYGGTGG